MAGYRFAENEIFDNSFELHHQLFVLATLTSNAKSIRIANQLRVASVNISGKIAENKSSLTQSEWIDFLKIARGTIVEIANISFSAFLENLIDHVKLEQILNELYIHIEKIQQSEKQFIRIIKKQHDVNGGGKFLQIIC